MKLSVQQISDMKHAIGGQVKDNPYRNHFNTGTDDASWNELVEVGLATKQIFGKAMGGIFYRVTKKGIDVLKEILSN